jgi:hypothetical protein
MADRTISNPQRGCGTLDQGKAYIRGVVGSPDGILPSFVKCDPFVPYREMGTDGEFTRGFLQFDGTSAQFALSDITDFERLYPGDADDQQAVENMVERGLYGDAGATYGGPAPDFEGQRHVDRIQYRGTEGSDHFGGVPAVRQSDLLMRAGKTHYPDPQDYIDETVEHGISKAIPLSQRQEPPVIQPGVTRCWIVHPDTDQGWAVIGYAYLNEVVFTEPADGHVPEYVQEYAAAGRLDVVDIEPAPDAADQRPDAELDQFDEYPDPSDGDGADTVVPSEGGSGDVQKLSNALRDAFSYNELKRISAAADDVDVGARPSQEHMADALELAGITLSNARDLLDQGDDDD